MVMRLPLSFPAGSGRIGRSPLRLPLLSPPMKLPVFALPCLVLGALSAVAAAPVVRWDFGEEEFTRLEPVGAVQRDVPGPRPPEFPDFERTNTAAHLDGNGARFVLADPGAGSAYDFTNGDAITLEAWVKVDGAKSGDNLYVVGKGRTGAPGFAADNQNWALRLRLMNGQYAVNFLFATPRTREAGKSDAHWHRWTTKSGFVPGTGWHHVAVTYRFGEPESVRGWLDGKALPGVWDMGGATKAAPVVDDDAIWIGSSMQGGASASFRGSLDAVAIHREIVGEAELKARFRRTGGAVVAKAAPAVMPDLGTLPAGRVVATFHEGMPTHDRWLNDGEKLPAETVRWSGGEFLLPRLPLRYDDWGIRAGWKPPVLVRLASDVALPAGQHRVVLRARGLSRLWVDGKIVAVTTPQKGDSGGHDPVTPIATPPLPGLRPVPFGVQESFGEVTIPAGRSARVVLEHLSGGRRFRADPGELTVAVQAADGRTFHVLQAAGAAGEPVPLTDAAVNASLTRIEASLAALDDQNRRTAAKTREDFWGGRHRVAQAWVQKQPAVPVPAGAPHPIDAFLGAKITQAKAEAARTPEAAARQFHETVWPILRDECFRCHGEKEKGGLKLNSRAAALAGGESKHPAVVPGNPAASELLARIKHADDEERMPPKGGALKPEQIAILEAWVKAGAAWPAAPLAPETVALTPPIDDAAFLRRVTFDTVGLPPTEREVRAFLADRSADKRARVIDRLIADERWADQWVSYWQDVLAENPSMLKPSLNNTGPFRWYLHEALRDGKGMDRLVTELILLRGSEREGGSAGFGLAADNDAPFAAKGHIVASAFLGIELQCARCHDSPYHTTTQRDLYAIAALFERKSVTVPVSSTVPPAFFEKKARESLIKVTLKPKEPVAPVWPFAAQTGVVDDGSLDALMQNPRDPRERLATLLTAPANTRFAQVMVNRIWKRLMGAGFVEPAHDWEGRAASHPELLAWLARDFVTHGYDLRQLARLIFTSAAYQRAATGRNLTAPAEQRFFAAPEARRLSAEQVVDALFAVSGQPIDVEEITLDGEARRPADSFISLGAPRRAWMFASLSNERDRPSLNLPRAQMVVDVLEAFGWTGSRQNPRTDRETDANVLQPGALANSVVSIWVTRAAQGSELADLAVTAASPAALVERLFLRCYGRWPTAKERAPLVQALTPGFAQRVLPPAEVKPVAPLRPLPSVSWANHLVAEANSIKLEQEQRARVGPPADPRLRAAWREVFEDVTWSLINTREFVWLP
jgi:mono/diheme cytochrome c family protein